jgi:hypothetical protein
MIDDEDTTAVLDAMRGSLGPVAMRTPVEDIVAAGRRRRRGRRAAAATAGVAAAAGLAVAVTANGTAPPTGGVHVHTAAFTVDSTADGSVRVTWDKQRYFTDHDGLQAALRQAGIPVLVKVGEFCLGPGDDPTLTDGSGPGIDAVMHGERLDGKQDPGRKPGGNRSEEAGSQADKKAAPGGADSPKDGQQPAGDGADPGPTEQVQLVFSPSAIPPGKQLFIGYLSPAQLAVTDGHPGSIERLVPIDGPLVCTPDLPAGIG